MAIKKVFVVSAETKKAQKNVDDLTEQLEIQDRVINDLTKDLERQQRALENTSTKNLAARKKINAEIKKTKIELVGEKRARTDLTKQRTKANAGLKESTKNQKKLTGVMFFINKATGGAIVKMQAFSLSVNGATAAMTRLKIAVMASGIGLLVVGITSVILAFKRSEEGQNRFRKILGVIGSVIGNLLDLLTSFGEAIINVFTNPLDSIKKLAKGIKENIINRFKALLDTLGFVGKAMKQVLSGQFNAAARTAKKAASSMVDSLTGVEDSINKVGNAWNRTSRDFVDDWNTATRLADNKSKADLIERGLIVKRAEADRKISDIRLKAEDRLAYNATQRIALLKEAQQIEEKITNQEIYAAKIRVQNQIDQIALTDKATKQDKDRLANLEAKLVQLDTKKLRSQRLLQTQITTARNEEIAKNKAAAQEFAANNIYVPGLGFISKEAYDTMIANGASIQKIQDEYEQKIKDEKESNEEEKALLEKEKALAKLDELNATEEQKANIIAYWDGKIQEGKDIDAENENKRDEAVKNAKLGIAKNTMALIGMIAGEGSRIGKAMAIGQATISGYQGVQNAYSTAQESPITALFPAYPVIQAGLAGVFAAANIAKIASTKPTGSSGTGGLSANAAAPQSRPQAPSFNIVGQGGTSQIASAIGEQQQQPVQAFVVSQDVTTAQSLENGIIHGATLGG